jgi:hypothetical protein
MNEPELQKKYPEEEERRIAAESKVHRAPKPQSLSEKIMGMFGMSGFQIIGGSTAAPRAVGTGKNAAKKQKKGKKGKKGKKKNKR